MRTKISKFLNYIDSLIPQQKHGPVPAHEMNQLNMHVKRSGSMVDCLGSCVVSLSRALISLLSTGPKVIKLFPCSTQQSTKFILLINVKMPAIVGIFNIYKHDK